WLAVGGDKAVTVWDLNTRQLLFALPEERGTIWSLAWSPDKRLLAVGSSHGGIVLWDVPRIKTELSRIGLGWWHPPCPDGTWALVSALQPPTGRRHRVSFFPSNTGMGRRPRPHSPRLRQVMRQPASPATPKPRASCARIREASSCEAPERSVS